MKDRDKLVMLFNHMMHQRIDGITVDNDELTMVLEDDTNITFSCAGDLLNIGYIMPQKTN